MDVYSKGDLVRWMIGHASYAAHNDPAELVGHEPIYKYGIVMQVSTVDHMAIVVHSCGFEKSSRLIILNGEHDSVEVLSKGKKQDV